MLPATEVPRFRLDVPDETEDDVADALKRLGSKVQIPQVLVRVLTEYHKRYSRDGTPIFTAGSYLSPLPSTGALNETEQSYDIVESFALSVTLTLATLGFCQVYRASVQSDRQHRQIDELITLANDRLTAAMIGLLRSFTVLVYHVDSDEGRILTRTVNQSAEDRDVVVRKLRDKLRPTIAGLRDLTVGISSVSGIGEAKNLLECGWSWGIIDESSKIDFVSPRYRQEPGYAVDEPYLYFTVQALDGIADLFSSRTVLLGLLDEDQLRLRSALQLRFELTQNYWWTVAGFGSERWPLEDLPWRTTDNIESDYFSLLVTSIATRGLLGQRSNDADLGRLGQVLTELANRARITRRPSENDGAVALHQPGVGIGLSGSEKRAVVQWVAADFAPLLLKRSIRIARHLQDPRLRARQQSTADQVWEHLVERRIVKGEGAGLWDQPSLVFPELTDDGRLSWHHTVRVVESLVFAADLAVTQPLPSSDLEAYAHDLLYEAEHLLDRERLINSTMPGTKLADALERLKILLQRARLVVEARPGTSVALVSEVLRELDKLAAARGDETGGR
ncbi:hypothetical protein Cs7R123_31690 [Catellatospora sp. TT07R-123]|nr:hypothetical protein Cs7R123_31690 [Catellatospora sp. TT07R-123]